MLPYFNFECFTILMQCCQLYLLKINVKYVDVKMLCPATDLFLFKDLHIFAVLELVFDIFVWSLHPCNLPSHHGMIDKWPKYSGHFLPNSSTANTKITVTQRHPNQEYSFKTRKNFFLGPHHNKTEKKKLFFCSCIQILKFEKLVHLIYVAKCCLGRALQK